MWNTSNTKDKLLSIIAHDLKSPFNALIGISELLSNDYHELEPDEIKLYIQTLHKLSSQTYNLLEHLIAWARAQNSCIETSCSRINVRPIIAENIALFEIIAKEKNIELKFEDHNDLFVVADPDMVNTIIRNLLSNALKFTGANGSIQIFTNTGDDFIDFCISDTGYGLSEKEKNNLFKPTADEGNRKGNGLGLVLCREFIIKNGGKIWVESEPGKGSRFWFSLKKHKVLSPQVFMYN